MEMSAAADFHFELAIAGRVQWIAGEHFRAMARPEVDPKSWEGHGKPGSA